MNNDSYKSPWLRVIDLRVNKAILAISSGDMRDSGLDDYEGVNLGE